MKAIDLELLKRALSDNRVHIALGKILILEVSQDRSILRVKVCVYPESREVVAMMSWEHVGPDCGIFVFPVVGDLVLVAFAEGDEEQAIVIKRLTSKEDKIPVQALDGHTVIKALGGKKAEVLSDTAVLLGRGGADPAQPLVLGTVFKTAYSSDLQACAVHKHIGNLGYYTAPPDNAATFTALKASPVDDILMLSDLSRTEK